MRSRSENPTPQSKTPVFDIDDLSFFRFYGIGLRHVELDLGLREKEHGNTRGDAVSLANYGLSETFRLSTTLDMGTCESFQAKVESFILDSYKHYHDPLHRFNDAAFILLMRGIDACCPYDFDSYPLGKCGSQAFEAKQIMSLIPTDKFINEDINHAVYNTLMALKTVCRQLKMQKAKELFQAFEDNPELNVLFKDILSHYENNTFLENPFFLTIANYRDTKKLNKEQLKEWLQQVDVGHKKGETSLTVVYKPANFEAMDAQELSHQLIHFIKNQNLEKVCTCLEYLRKTQFNPAGEKMPDPLQMAAMGKNTNILKAVYEFDPNNYNTIVANIELATPIFIAASDSNLSNLQYLLSVRPIISRDITFSKKHIMADLVRSADPSSYHIMQLLMRHKVGFDFTDPDTYRNPIAGTARVWAGEFNMKKFQLALPLANAFSKYLGILSSTHELYYCYGQAPRSKFYFTDERINQLFVYRSMIIESLTPAECDEIRTLFFSDKQLGCDNAKEILLDDLFKFEIQMHTNPEFSSKINRCFISPNPTDTSSISSVNRVSFYQPTVTKEPDQQADERYHCCII